jgi:hypothetical protein
MYAHLNGDFRQEKPANRLSSHHIPDILVCQTENDNFCVGQT